MLSISPVTLDLYNWSSSKLCKCTFCFCIKHILNLDEPKHSNPSLARPPLGVKHIAKEWVEALCKNPGTLQLWHVFVFLFRFMLFKRMNLIFHNPVLHLPQPLLFLRVAECDHSSHQVFKVFHVLQSGPRFTQINVSWSYVKISESDPLHVRPPWLGRWQGFSVPLQQLIRIIIFKESQVLF